MGSNNPIVSVICCTYNHESYIRQCLEGFVKQKTNFAFEVLVHDDASTDKTADIIKEYETKYPDMIKPIYQVENQYSKGVGINSVFNYPRAKGKYIALCEGDDYWTDPLKLQRQVDFLDNNIDYGLCYSKAISYDENSKLYLKELGHDAKDLKDLILKNKIVTLTVMFRVEARQGYEEFIEGQQWQMGDKPLWCYIALKYKIHFEDKIVGVYRILQNSAMQRSFYEKRRDFLNSSFAVSLFFSEKCRLGLDYEITKNKYITQMKVAILYKKYFAAFNYGIKFLKYKFLYK